MKFLTVLIILASSSVSAQSIDRSKINQSLQEIKTIPLSNNGKDGVWFEKKDAEIVLDLVKNKFKLALDIIDDQAAQAESLKIAVEALKLSNQSYLDLADINKQMFDVAMKHMPDLDPPEPPWYKNSKATFVFGIIVGGATMFGSTYLAVRTLK